MRSYSIEKPRNRFLCLTFLLALYLGIGGAGAQNGHLLRGMVLDSLSREPVPFAAVSFTPIAEGKEGSALQQLTDDGGRFAISLPVANEYKVEASFVGKKMQSQILPYSKVKSMGMLRLFMEDDAENLAEVTVTAARPLVRLDADRIAYNVKDDPLSKAESLRDMLRKVPLVTVDGEGNVSVKGSKNFRIYLNGKPSKMISSNPKEVLRSIPASTIKSVEVITEPGVKYEAEGVGAILNIITEQTSFEGYQAQIGVNGSIIQPGGGGNVFFTSKVGKFGVTANYHGGVYNFSMMPMVNTSVLTYRDTGIRFTSENTVERNKSRYGYHMGGLNLTYDFNERNLLSLNVDLSSHNTPGVNITTTRTEDPSGKLLAKDGLRADTKSSSTTLETRLDYEHTTALKGESLTLSYQWVHTPNHSEVLTDQKIFDPKNAESILQTNRQFSQTDAAFNEHTGQIDYVRPFGDKWKVEAGLKSIFRLGATESVFKVLDKISNEWVVGSLFGQHLGISGSPMAYKQNIYGAYGNVTYLKGKVSLVAGARAEYGVQNVEFAKEPKANLHHTFLDVVPQLIATWTLADADQLKLGYNYRIQRPSITQLNPYREQVSPLLVKYGNENLSNERVHALDATYSHYTQKFSLMLSASYQFSNNKVEEYFFSQLDDKGNRILHQTYTDKGKMRSLGFNLFTQYVPASWVRLYLQGNLDFVTLDASGIKINGKDDYGNTVMKGLGGNSFVGATFTLPKNWSLGVNAGIFIQPPTINLKSFWGSWHHLSVSKSFLKQRLTLSGWISNPFSPWYNFNIEMSSPSFKGETRVRNYGLSTGISISYSFGNLKSAIRKVSRTIENKDLMSSEKKEQGAGGAPGGVGGN